MSGRFVSLEGGEGVGKSTQARRLAELLRGLGDEVVETREPGGTPGAEAIRALVVDGGEWDAWPEALLMAAARADHVGRLIRPALERGAWVISDRFVHSTLAYQGAGRGLDPGALRTLHAMTTGDVWPDLTLLLDLSVDAGLARATARGATGRFERADRGFHERVRDAFLAMSAADPARVVVIDAGGAPDAVAEDIKRLLTPLPDGEREGPAAERWEG